jgi:hypothetical protein
VVSAPVSVVVNVPANGYFIDAVNGSDTANTGAQGSPFKTIQKGVGLLTLDGQSIYLATGTYDSSTQTNMHFTFAHSTNVRALAAGVVLTGIASQGNGNGLTFQNGGEARNIAITNQYGGIYVPAGTFHAINVTMDNVYDGFDFMGTSVGVIDETGIATPITNVPGAALAGIVTAEGGSVVTFNGGGMTFNGGGVVLNALFVRAHGTLTVNDLSISNCASYAALLYDNGHLTMNDVNITTSGLVSSGSSGAVISMGGENEETPMTSTLTINGGGITHSSTNGIVLELYGTTAETPTITLSNTHVDSSTGVGLWVAGTVTDASLAVTLNVTNTTFDSNTTIGLLTPLANLTMTGGSVSNNTGDGIQFNPNTGTATTGALKIRGTAFASNGGDSIDVNASVTSTVDLGKTGDPGGLVFTGVPASFDAVHLEAAIPGSAVGNTWIPSVQGSDVTGKYTTPTTLTSATPAGTNVKLVAGASLVVD